ncbi:MAG: Bifunctional ligase/repressor BirA [Anaerolineales bacterium]|nr:Bifunctional ligase/repressor BirA [Anaerolineales bacterium]
MQKEIQTSLASLNLKSIRYFESIGSTNDEALAWAAQGTEDLSLVLADEQTSGRGRAGRKWASPRGDSISLSLILRPRAGEADSPSLFTGLAALALVDALKQRRLTAQIKWPNDVLLNQKKCAGILVESVWSGDALDAVVIGVGVNVLAGSVPHESELLFPATSLESELGHAPNRSDLLRDVLSALLKWRPLMNQQPFIQAWEAALAFKGQMVRVWRDNETPLEGIVMGLAPDGNLRLLSNDKIVTVHFGEIHLRPAL